MTGRTIDITVGSKCTDRERQIIRMLAEGLTKGEVGESLGILPGTVATHVERARRRLGAKNTVQAVHLAHRRGWLR